MNFDSPYLIIDDINKKYIKDLGDVYHTARILQLEVYRTGASLFYRSCDLAFASCLFAIMLQNGDILPPSILKTYCRELYQDNSASKNQGDLKAYTLSGDLNDSM
jgi:hypothetical protein